MLSTFRSFRLAATVLAFPFLAACSKDDPTPAADVAGMSWTVDGGNVTALSVLTPTSGNSVVLAGSAISGTVGLTVPKTTGSYPLGATTDAAATYLVPSVLGSSQTYVAVAGSIVVSSVSATNISGTFTFTGQLAGGSATKTLTNGKFNVKL